ncbi:MAG: cytochrome-c oxidase, cbb3-type subunit III [Chromatiales bacterium]|nr:cytochrome-c oxidase, cbb3-type subunit III [Chromatiales bacterium]
MSGFWNAWVWVLTLGTLAGCLWLLQALTTKRKEKRPEEKSTTGHVWDGDLVELNNPLPRWWLWLFWITGIFMIVYLVIYPGLGNFAGIGGWSQKSQYEAEMAAAEKRFGNVFAAFSGVPLPELEADPDALRLGRNIFLNRCSTCHGSDGRGAKGFPNLTDSAWLWGNAPDTIIETITNGRTGMMPALGPALGEQGVTEVIAWLRALPKLPASALTDPAGLAPDVAAGRQKFMSFCIGCHGADAKGNQVLGAPNLTDTDWLHGSTDADIRDVLMKGRTNQMPAQHDYLTPDRIRVLAAYVLSLGNGGGARP